MEYTVAIVGGGASGMLAAITAAEQGASVLLLERNDALGKKILATGNGKCNLTNTVLHSGCYYSDDLSLVEKVIADYPTDRICEFFEASGILLKNKNGYIYPNSEQAVTVRDLLTCRVSEAKVTIVYSEYVKSISQKNGIFKLSGEKNTYFAKNVILACGGEASPKSGSDGTGYALAKGLGHQITKRHPALVQLIAREKYCKKLSGVRAMGEVSFLAKKKGIEGIHKDLGEIQLTDYGISGIPVFQISGYVNQELEEAESVKVKVDFLPEYSVDQLKDIGRERYERFSNRSIAQAMEGMVNSKLMEVCIAQCGINAQQPMKSMEKDKIITLLLSLKKMTFTITGSKSYEQAQVTRGGVPLQEITEQFASKKMKGLYLCGEILNVDGICGGYNLHFAWASGMIAGRLGK